MLSRGALDQLGRHLEAQEIAWAKAYAAAVPADFRREILADRIASIGAADAGQGERRRAANCGFRARVDDLRESSGLALDATDEEIRAAGRDLAASAYELALQHGVRTLEGIRDAVSDMARRRGIEPPGPDVETGPALCRLFEGDWWIRKLRRVHAQRVERVHLEFGRIHKRGQCYVSDANVWRRVQQIDRNRKILEAAEVENQFGDVATLADLAERSNANPAIKRGELMTRIAGFEAVARGLGHAAEFVTVTCPSRFHSVLAKSCQRNPKYQEGQTPRDGANHLQKAWQRCRAALNRRGIFPYGFRIAEPHHDGCPHWHLLLFMPAQMAGEAARSMVARFRALVRRYFWRQHDADEAGAKANRCKFVSIDWARGSAAGYVAKYVAKNVDGFRVESDLYGNPAEVTARRVDAWASTWRIRQFSQIGGAPVSVWRELRRLESGEGLGSEAEAARVAADAGDWGAYILAQGGPNARRDDLAVRVAYTQPGERWCPVAGDMLPAMNRYEEPAGAAVWGVRPGRRDPFAWDAVASRFYKWGPVSHSGGRSVPQLSKGTSGGPNERSVEREGMAGSGGRSAARGEPARGRGLRQAQGNGAAGAGGARDFRQGGARYGAQGIGVSGRQHAGPWTRVNNCTGGCDEGRSGGVAAAVGRDGICRVWGSGSVGSGSGGAAVAGGSGDEGGSVAAGAGAPAGDGSGGASGGAGAAH